MSGPLLLVYGLWIAFILDPHFWLVSMGAPGVITKAPTGLAALLGLLAVASGLRRSIYPKLFLFLCAATVMGPFAIDKMMLVESWQKLVLFYLLGLGTLQFVDTPRKLYPIILLYVFQVAWWAYFSRLSGLVSWHTTLANYDTYGPLMVMGGGLCYYFGVGTPSKRLRILAYLLAGFCVLGVVTSFARGAVLSLGLLVGLVWVRAPRKGPITGAVLAGVVLLVATVRLKYPGGEFWDEMASSFSEGTDEGTGGDRWDLWKAGMIVFRHRPIFGTGASNWGVLAAQIVEPGDVGGRYSENPARLWGRSLHSIYLQTLVEFGLVGATLFILLVADFWRRNSALKSAVFARQWASHGKDLPKLGDLARGLEAAMIAYLATGFFYDQLFQHWVYTLLIINFVLFEVSKPPQAATRRRARPVRRGA